MVQCPDCLLLHCGSGYDPSLPPFLRAKAECFARLCHRLGVCLSVTLVSCIKTVQARITKFSLWAGQRSLVYCDKISCHWVQGFPSNEGVEEGYPLKNYVVLPLLARIMWKRLQIGTYMLLIITSTGDRLFRFINIDDLERPWTPQREVFSEFFAIFGCSAHFNTELRLMAGDRPRQPAYEIFSIQCRFQQFKSRPPRFKEAGAGGRQRQLPPPKKWLFYHNYLV